MKLNLNVMILSMVFVATACNKSTRVATNSPRIDPSALSIPNAIAIPETVAMATPVPAIPIQVPSPTPVPTPTPTPAPAKSLKVETSAGFVTLNVYSFQAPQNQKVFGALSVSQETLNHSADNSGNPVSNDSTNVLPGTFPVYLDSVNADGVLLDVYPDADIVQKIVNPVLSDTHPVFKVPRVVCVHYGCQPVHIPGMGPGSDFQPPGLTCTYSDTGTQRCVYDDSKQGFPYNPDDGHPEFYCDRSTLIYPTQLIQTVEDFVRMKSISVQVFSGNRDFSIPFADRDEDPYLPVKKVHLIEDQIVFGL